MADAPMRHEFQVVSRVESVPRSRHETAKVLCGWGLAGDVVDTACLIVTELVANVVRHAALLSPTAGVCLTVDADALTLTVTDTHPFKPKPLPTAHDHGGRGLRIVSALVAEVHGSHDVVPDGANGGKRIVVRLPLAPLPV
ncbi:ATP-binding protein [Streptomyces uncialis]|uniref:ATP-binding protein n=1 Tax=Streptomyces uncialis TaxID=1048205 RepID=UPI003405971B